MRILNKISYNELKFIMDRVTKIVESHGVNKDIPSIDLLGGYVEALPGEFKTSTDSHIMLHAEITNLFEAPGPCFYKVDDNLIRLEKEWREEGRENND